MKSYPPPMERLLSKISKTANGCWEFLGALVDGYGQLKIGGKIIKTHRLSFKLFRGEIPNGLCVCHKCDNRRCVNPDHLFLGTNLDNVRDKVAKGRNVNPNKFYTHCKHGHEFSAKNTYIRKDNGGRCCRECGRIRKAAQSLKKALVLFVLIVSHNSNAAITDDFLNRVEVVESGGKAGAVGDGGKALGLFQFHAEAWADCSEIRRSNGLKVYPYYCATNAYVDRLYSGTWFQYLHSRLSLEMKRPPTDAHVYAAFNIGYRGMKTRGFDLRKVPTVTKKAIAKL